MVANDSVQSYAVIDCAQDERLLPAISAMVPGARCLFDEPLDEALAAAAPWMLPLAGCESFMDFWRHNGDGQHWGFVFETVEAPDLIRRHLKKLLRARLPDQKVVLFRFYDPRVLQEYLSCIEASEREYFFGPMLRIHCEGLAGERPTTLVPEHP